MVVIRLGVAVGHCWAETRKKEGGEGEKTERQ